MATPFGRFSYFYFREINPLLSNDGLPEDWADQAAHNNLSTHYQREHETGNAEAFFEYAKADGWAFRSPWFRAQVEAWRVQGTADSIKKLRDLMKSYTASQGKVTHKGLVEIVKRDQAMFKDVMRLRQMGLPLKTSRYGQGCYDRLAEDMDMKVQDTIEAVYKAYSKAVKSHGPEQKGDGMQAVFDWLDTMAQRLQNWGNEDS